MWRILRPSPRFREHLQGLGFLEFLEELPRPGDERVSTLRLGQLEQCQERHQSG
jgi:hypothetical protein